MDETYIKVKGAWVYLYRAVDSGGNTIEFLLSATRDTQAAKHFFLKALGASARSVPQTNTIEKKAVQSPVPTAFKERKKTAKTRNSRFAALAPVDLAS